MLASFRSGKKSKPPKELVEELSKDLNALNSKEKSKEKNLHDDISKHLESMKVILYGDGAEIEPSTAEICGQLSHELAHSDVLPLLITHLPDPLFTYETRKDVSQIFTSIMKKQVGSRFPIIEFLSSTSHTIIHDLILEYDNRDAAIHSGLILKEACKNEDIARLVMWNDEDFFLLIKSAELPNFDAAADAFATLKDLLTRHKPLAAEYLESHFVEFFTRFSSLMQSGNYVTRRQSVKLLGELLLDRSNFNTMTKYISDPGNLKIVMVLLRDKYKTIQFEAFHVFKVFVANPQKAQPIIDILKKNQQLLVQYLQQFQPEKEDELFVEEKSLLIKEINSLK